MTRRPVRPRDPLGRPLPPDPAARIEPDPPPLPADETLELAQQLLDDGRAFRAHEVFEARWKAVDGPQRQLWRGLAQLAVGVTHAQRGNASGRAALLARAADSLGPWQGQRPEGVDIDALRAWALDAATTGSSAADLLATMPRLRSGGG